MSFDSLSCWGHNCTQCGAQWYHESEDYHPYDGHFSNQWCNDCVEADNEHTQGGSK